MRRHSAAPDGDAAKWYMLSSALDLELCELGGE